MPVPFRKTLFAIVLASAGSAASAAPGTLAFVGARIIDGTGAPAIEDAVLVATDGRIVAVGPAASTPVPEDAQRIDVAGKTLIPGLINTHVTWVTYSAWKQATTIGAMCCASWGCMPAMASPP